MSTIFVCQFARYGLEYFDDLICERRLVGFHSHGQKPRLGHIVANAE
jgi:hypothetical protein